MEIGSAPGERRIVKPESTWTFWKTCVVMAAKGASPFANDWQWVWGVPVWQWASGTSLFTWLFVGLSVSDGHGGMTTGHPWLDGLIAAAVAFLITWLIAFISRIFTVAAERYNEAVARADALGIAHSDAELRTAHTKAIEEHTKALREQTVARAEAAAPTKPDGQLSYTELASRARDLAAQCRTAIEGHHDDDIDFSGLYEESRKLKIRVSGTSLAPILEPLWTNLHLCLGTLDNIARLIKRDAESSRKYRYETDILDERMRLTNARYATLTASDSIMTETAKILKLDRPDAPPNEKDCRPNFTIRELFLALDARAVDNIAVQSAVGQAIRDKLAIEGLLTCWGRPVKVDWVADLVGDKSRPVPVEIPSSYWQNADFTYTFLGEYENLATHATSHLGSGLPAYSDLRVNKSQALALDWSDIGKFLSEGSIYPTEERQG